MEKGYVIKVCGYLMPDGRITRSLNRAHFIKDEELAEAAAVVAYGKKVAVLKEPMIRSEANETIEPVKKESKKNQSWMEAMKNG